MTLDLVVKEIPSLYLDETAEAKVSHTFGVDLFENLL